MYNMHVTNTVYKMSTCSALRYASFTVQQPMPCLLSVQQDIVICVHIDNFQSDISREGSPDKNQNQTFTVEHV